MRQFETQKKGGVYKNASHGAGQDHRLPVIKLRFRHETVACLMSNNKKLPTWKFFAGIASYLK